MKMLRWQWAGLILAAVVCAGVTHADDPAATTIETRQKGLKSMGAASKTIRDELRGGADKSKIQAAAADIKKAADAIKDWFPKGTGPEAGVKTDAKPEIWTDAVGFAQARDRFFQEAGKFSQTVQTGDLAAIDEGMKILGQTCKGCHDNYKAKKGR